MTIKIGSFQIVLFKVTKLERYDVNVNKEASAQQASEIKQSAYFQELKAKAQALRASK